ncbi:MAG: LIM domain-containing protein [Anaerovoracaceae bacterium]
MERKPTLLCNKCQVPLTPSHLGFSYLNRYFHGEVLRCPECGQVFVSEEYAKGKIVDVETKIEDDFRTLNS